MPLFKDHDIISYYQSSVSLLSEFHVQLYFPYRMIWKMHGCTRKSMDIRIKVSVYTDVHGQSKHSMRKSM